MTLLKRFLKLPHSRIQDFAASFSLALGWVWPDLDCGMTAAYGVGLNES